MDKLTAIRIKHNDGTYSEEIPLRVVAENVVWDQEHNLIDVLGTVDLQTGDIQQQLDEKVDHDDLNEYLQQQISTDVSTWLDENISGSSTVIIDTSLSTPGAAADAAAAGGIVKVSATQPSQQETNNRIWVSQQEVEYEVPTLTQFNELSAHVDDIANSIPAVDSTLEQTGQAADAKVVGDEIDGLKEDLSGISQESYQQYQGTLYAYVSTSGVITSASYARTVYINVEGMETITVSKTAGQRFVVGFSETIPNINTTLTNVVSDYTASKITANVPTGAKYAATYVWNLNYDTVPVDVMMASVKINPDITAIDKVARASLTRFNDYVDNINKNTQFRVDNAAKTETRNLFDGTFYDGYMQANGAVTTGNYKYTSLMDVHNHIGETLAAFNQGSQKYLRFICVLNQDQIPVPELGTNTNALTFNIPEGAYYIVVSFPAASITSPDMLITTDDNTAYVPHNDKWIIDRYKPVLANACIPKPVQLMADSLADGQRITGTANSVKRLATYVFYCKPGTLTDDNYIIMGKDSSRGYAVGISATNWAWFVNDIYQGGGTHGLTIKDYLMVIINKVPGTGAVLTIYTNGGTYTRTNTSWTDDHGAPYVLNNSGDAITDVKMSWASSAFRSRNWVFGDSYVSIATTRWPKYIYDLGFGDNLLINGYPGEQSAAGYADLLDCINYGIPSLAVWCLGMNDADDGAINNSWLMHVQAFIEICELYDITPILATIPCCPIADHKYKNAWVRASGYRYIDFAGAVNVTQDSTAWYAGMLSGDNIHPTDQGAIALATQVMTDVPELLIK